MGIIETIKNAIIGQFTGPVSIEKIVTSLVVSFILAMFILLIYKKTFTGIVYNRTISLTIILLAMTTAMIIRTINSNLSLSLGMVGALSIVRFRTAIKEPVDTAFMFWAITAGIMSGAGLYLVAIIATLALGLFYYIAYSTSVKAASRYLLVVVYNKMAEAQVKNAINSLGKSRLKSKSANGRDNFEVTYEVVYNDKTDGIINHLQEIEGVKNVNLVTYTNEFGL